MSGLAYLNLNALHKVTDSGVLQAARASPSLKGLELYWHHSLASKTVADVAKACPKLERLNLSGCQKLEDGAVRALARHCPMLTDLDLTRCPLLTDDALEFLGPRLPRLKKLNLYADSQLGAAAGYLAIAKLLNLEELDLCGAPKLSSEVRRGARKLADTLKRSLKAQRRAACAEKGPKIGVALGRARKEGSGGGEKRSP